jgi:hypothetical protein
VCSLDSGVVVTELEAGAGIGHSGRSRILVRFLPGESLRSVCEKILSVPGSNHHIRTPEQSRELWPKLSAWDCPTPFPILDRFQTCAELCAQSFLSQSSRKPMRAKSLGE